MGHSAWRRRERGRTPKSSLSVFLSYHDIRERLAGFENRSFAKVNQRPKLGSEGKGVNVRFWVHMAAGRQTKILSLKGS